MKTSGFQSTPSGGKATEPGAYLFRPARSFNPRLPGGRRLIAPVAVCSVTHSFNPRLPGGRRLRSMFGMSSRCCFNPRLPGGRRRHIVLHTLPARLFQSTPSGGKATRHIVLHTLPARRFNPRLPGGRRRHRRYPAPRAGRFNPRLPGGRRQRPDNGRYQCIVFQSTPSGGKATNRIRNHCTLHYAFQSTPSGGKATCAHRASRQSPRPFQSTPSGGKATWCPQPNKYTLGSVSIHAFRGEGDSTPERTQ